MIIRILISALFAYFSQIYFSLFFKNFFYTVSLFLKDLMMIFLPFFIMFSVAFGLSNLKKNPSFLLLKIILFVIISNTFFSALSYLASSSLFDFLPKINGLNIKNINTTKSLWSLPNRLFFSPLNAVFFGAIWGLMARSDGCLAKTRHVIEKCNEYFQKTLNIFFSFSMPIYVFGFFISFFSCNCVSNIREVFDFFLIVLCLVTTCVLLLYIAIAKGNVKLALSYLLSATPAAIIGFGTTSQSSAMPLMILCAEKNTKDKCYPKFFIPTVLNMHMIGENLILPLTGLFLAYSSQNILLDFKCFSPFLGMYLLTRFYAFPGPGGSVFLVMPLCEKYFGLPESISSMMLIFYIFLDPLITMINVFGNIGASILTFNIFKVKQ